jgi:hypothetical protein
MGAVVLLQEGVVVVAVVVELAAVLAVAVEAEEDVVAQLPAAAVKQMCVLRNPQFTNYQNRYYSPLLVMKCQQRFARQ